MTDEPTRPIAVELTARTRSELYELADLLGLNAADVVNRAVQIYRELETRWDGGYDVLYRRRKTGEVRPLEWDHTRRADDAG